MVHVSAFLLFNYMHNYRFGEAAEGHCGYSSPREKRNARKRSFEQCMSATAAKIYTKDGAGERDISWREGKQYIVREGEHLV